MGSIVAAYPLQLWQPREPRFLETIDFLLEHCFHDGAFFQDMIHSGMNAYLSLHCAQGLMRTDDDRFFPIVQRVAELASPTGQWPEAIHPHTLGGCMGDGQHVWAAAEWLMMMRNLFVREEGEALVLLQGIPSFWFDAGDRLELGPTHTTFGSITVRVDPGDGAARVHWEAHWRRDQPKIEIRLPGHEPIEISDKDQRETTGKR